ncbi:hypothetical protein AB4851_26695 [Burkholderia sp. 22PA0099]
MDGERIDRLDAERVLPRDALCHISAAHGGTLTLRNRMDGARSDGI